MRLTKDLKSEIVANAIRSTFKDRLAAMESDKSDFADEVYRFVVGEHEQAINDLPEGFFSRTKTIRAFFGDNNNPEEFNMTEVRRTPYLLGPRWSSDSMRIKDTKIVEALKKLSKKRIQLNKDIDTLKTTLNGVVNSVSTIKRLQEVWPESTPFIPAWAKEEKNLPAVIAKDINQLIKKMKAAA